MDEYSITKTALLFDKSRETIRVWTSTFAEYLSPSATPEKGQARRYIAADLEVFAYVAQERDNGLTFDQIAAGLANGQRGVVPNEPVAVDTSASGQIARLNGLIAHQRQQMRELEISEAVAKRERDFIEATYKQQLAEAQKKIDELNREIGRLEANRSR